MQGLNTRPPWTTYSSTILNHQFTQNLKLVIEGKFNYISLTVFALQASLKRREWKKLDNLKHILSTLHIIRRIIEHNSLESPE